MKRKVFPVVGAFVLGAIAVLAYQYYNKGQLDAAIAEFKEAIRLKPDLAEAHYDLGIALREKGQADGASAELLGDKRQRAGTGWQIYSP